MKKITIVRHYHSTTATMGTLSIDGVYIGHTLERPWVDMDSDGISDKMVSCINTGNYKGIIRHSAKFGTVVEFLNVPNRQAILIHPANYVRELQGCVAIGLDVRDETIGRSRLAMEALLKVIGDDKEVDIVVS